MEGIDMNYTLTETNYENVTFYGIKYSGEDANVEINDICSDKHKMRVLCDKLEQGRVDVTTLFDVIEDFLAIC